MIALIVGLGKPRAQRLPAGKFLFRGSEAWRKLLFPDAFQLRMGISPTDRRQGRKQAEG